MSLAVINLFFFFFAPDLLACCAEIIIFWGEGRRLDSGWRMDDGRSSLMRFLGIDFFLRGIFIHGGIFIYQKKKKLKNRRKKRFYATI